MITQEYAFVRPRCRHEAAVIYLLANSNLVAVLVEIHGIAKHRCVRCWNIHAVKLRDVTLLNVSHTTFGGRLTSGIIAGSVVILFNLFHNLTNFQLSIINYQFRGTQSLVLPVTLIA